ncbi:MAG TPA: glycoside hydrolase family 15 protein [Gammaproteobacteria bacterium]|jgi:GH15 family glucan-1,4-alpha-glucosidase
MAAESIPPPGEYDPARLPEYKPLAAYGLIGDTRSAALVGSDGSMDWLCLPDFDSPAVFAALLDPSAGRFAVHPTQAFRASQSYEPGTNVLCTELRCKSGVVCLRDFMPMVHERRMPETEIHRKIEVISGEVELEMEFAPRLDFGRAVTEVTIFEYGALAHAKGNEQPRLTLTTAVPLKSSAGSAKGRFTLKAGESHWAVLSWEGSALHPIRAYRSEQRLWRTRQYWHDWLSHLQYHGDYPVAMRRSLLILKLLTYSNTGAMVAAATASLPEWVGGRRNWDYRYAWVRDSSFMLRAFFTAGYIDEGTAYLDWLLKLCRDEQGDLRTLYDIHAEGRFEETELPLRGWRDSKPVRIGNAAVAQFQLDIYGSLIDAALHYQNSGGVLSVAEAETLMQLVERVRKHWREPDSGIWETRGSLKHYTYSKTWAWVALMRGAELAEKTGLDVDGELWKREADELQQELLARAWNPKLKAFTQSYDSEVLDAAVLVMPIAGIVKPDDPRFVSTREAVLKKLTAGRYPLLYRYDHREADDGVGGKEGAFLLPSFWLVEGLVMAGRSDEARAAFTRLLEYSSPLGLLSEQIDPEQGNLLGNLPQGFSHLGLINAALRLEAAQDELRPSNVGRAAAFSSSKAPISK